jgi:YbbR domain-containing protein
MDIPLKYYNLPANKFLNNADETVNVRLRAGGSDLFSTKVFTSRKPIYVDLSEVDIKKSRYFDRYYILANQINNDIVHRFDYANAIISIDPDTLFLNLEEIISKSLRVRSGLSITCKPQYQVYDSLTITPAEIIVSGPSSIIDTLRFIVTESKKLEGLSKGTETVISLRLPISNEKVSYSETEVKINIPVEEYTESSIELPIIGKSDDTGIKLRTFPETVQLTYQVAIKDFKLVRADMFQVSAIYDPIKDKGKTFLKVKLDKSPDFIKVSRILPERVEFIIQK